MTTDPADPVGHDEGDDPSEVDADPWFTGYWERCEEWARMLGLSWIEVREDAGIADEVKARSSKHRMAKGGAPRVRSDLLAALRKHEMERDRKTEVGRVMIGVERWAEIGRRLAVRDREAFLQTLDTVEKFLGQLEATPRKPDLEPKKKARAVGSANLVATVPTSPITTKAPLPSKKGSRPRKLP